MFGEKFFKHKKLNIEKLVEYGFVEADDEYHYEIMLMEDQFTFNVSVSPDGTVSTNMIDNMSNYEYELYKIDSSAGPYVGEVRAECEKVLEDISDKCYETFVFRQEQTLSVIDHVSEKYGDELEFLWEKFPDNAIWRRKDNRKWYGLIVTISRRKLGIDSDEIVEAIDLRLSPDKMPETVDREKYFPGWHMNKKTWYTIILDGSVPTEEICRRLDESYDLAK